ncbi:MAG: recombination protein RecR [Candidatus Eisenbacteria bacterium]|nr:recombination protein RecR [Candidatus Eisenbacteria bacterium]
MQYSSRYLESLVRDLARLPGIGNKTAHRLAFHLLRVPREEALALAQSITDVRTSVGTCQECGNIAETQPCYLCADPKRDRSLLCVVEQPGDVVLIERTGHFRGLYQVLRGELSPPDGVGPAELRFPELRERVRAGEFREVILATNPTSGGEATAHAIAELLAGLPVRVTRIARGVPVGSELEFSDQVTLIRALEGRKEA